MRPLSLGLTELRATDRSDLHRLVEGIRGAGSDSEFFCFQSLEHSACSLTFETIQTKKPSIFIKKIPFSLIVPALLFLSRSASATQADDTTITIDSQAAGATPFISQLTLTASDTTVIKSIQLTITPKSGSV